MASPNVLGPRLKGLLKPPSRERILTGPTLRTMARIGLPAAFVNLIFTLYSLANAFWVGRLPNAAAAIAGINVSWPVVWVILSFVMGFSGAAVMALVSQYTGANRPEEANLALNQFVSLAVFASVALGLAGYAAAPWFLRVLIVNREVSDAATPYIRILLLGLPTTMLPALFGAALYATGDSIIPLLVNFSGTVLNAVFDYFLVLGHGGFPQLGIVGAAYGTVTCQGLTMLAFIVIFVVGRGSLRLRWRDLRPRWDWMWRGLRIGMPAGLGQTGTAAGFLLLTGLIARLPNSEIAQAGYGLGDRVLGMFSIMSDGFATGLTTMIGQALGAGLKERVSQVLRRGLAGLFAILALEGVILVAFRHVFVSVLAPSQPEVLAVAAQFVLAFAVSLPCLGTFFASIAVYRAAGRNVPAMILELMRLWVWRLPLCWLLAYPLHLGADGVWWGMSASNAISGVVAIVSLSRPGWRQGVIEPIPQPGKKEVAVESEV